MIEIDVARELVELERSLDALEGLAHGPALPSRTEISRWSVGQHVAHIALATSYCLRNVIEIADGGGRHTEEGGQRTPIATGILRAASIPRGATAPAAVDVVEETPELTVTLERLARSRSHARALRARLDDVGPTSLRISHPILGPLDAPEWLRFTRIHAQHHLEIVAEILL